MNYLSFIYDNRRFLAFGVLLTSFSSFGQTFFVSLFSAEIRADFGLSHGGFGLLYSLSTLAGGILVMWLGRLIDKIDLRLYAMLTCAFLAASCVFLSVAGSVIVLFLALTTLRLAGQGLMSHIALTTMSRYFETGRGKAMSVAILGYPAGQAVFPLLAVATAAALGWREAWMAFGLGLAVILLPLVPWLLKGQIERYRRPAKIKEQTPSANRSRGRHWTQGEVLRDFRFYMLLPAILASSLVMTGFFFHQVHLAISKGWSVTWLATCFIGLAAAMVTTTVISGPLTDRIGATRLLPFYLLPLALGLLTLVFFDHPAFALVYMIAAGASAGASRTVNGSMLAEVYGVGHLGAIRSMVTGFNVFASAIAPVAMGWMIDGGMSIEGIALIALGYVLAGVGLVAATMGRLRSARVEG